MSDELARRARERSRWFTALSGRGPSTRSIRPGECAAIAAEFDMLAAALSEAETRAARIEDALSAILSVVTDGNTRYEQLDIAARARAALDQT